MGLIARIEYPEGHRIAFWEYVDGEFDQLHHSVAFTAEDNEEFAQLRNTKRKREWLASRCALRSGLAFFEKVEYLENGKPFTRPSALSFSHCLPLAGALLHPANAGMDIQLPDEKIVRIQEKFASAQEQTAAASSGNPLIYLTILWSVKEALFKVYGEDLPFIEGIVVEPFDPSPCDIEATVIHRGQSKRHVVRIFKIRDHWVAIVLR